MVKRAIVAAILASAACATVADTEVNRPPGSSGAEDRDDPSKPAADAAADSPNVDASPPDPLPDGGSTAPVHACACDAGAACCIASSSPPSCVAPNPSACSAAGSLLVGCVRPTTDGRDCCWKPDGGIAQSAFGAGCTFAACLVDDDCVPYGGKCTTLACDGVALGICANSAPSWFVCPP